VAPLRPIVNTIGNPTYQLAKYLAHKLKPLVDNTISFFKDSSFFVNKIKNIKLDKDDTLIRFNVVSLFTKIPIDGDMEVIKNITDLGTANLVEFCLKSSFFFSVSRVRYMKKPMGLLCDPPSLPS
jgi:hypothetical protein